MTRLCLMAGLAVLLAWPGQAMAESAQRTLVIVAAQDSPIEEITPRQVRLSYLAVPTRIDDTVVRPVLNTADPLLHEVFLQKTIFLSDQHYRRQAMAQVFRSGGTRPMEAGSNRELAELLRTAPDRISYMWKQDARQHDELKILLVVWQGSVQ